MGDSRETADETARREASWGALQSDDDLVTADEIESIDARVILLETEETPCLDWEMIKAYIAARPAPPTRSG